VRRSSNLLTQASDTHMQFNSAHPRLTGRAVAALAAAVLMLLAACSKDKNVDRPKELVKFTPGLKVERVWSASLGGANTHLRLGLALGVQGNRVYAAGHGGDVAAFDLNSGRRLWSRRTKVSLGGGPAASNDLVVVGSTDGDVIALAAADGTIRWHVNINGEIIEPAAVDARAVLVRAVDGKLHDLAPADGHELWQSQQQVPRLSLRGTSRPVISGDIAICGFDNGKVVAATLSDGANAWETELDPPHGRTEIQRLNDVDATPRIGGNDVYVAGFQGRVAMLALDSGQIWWAHDMSSYRGLAIDDETIFISTAEGDVIALRRQSGTELWHTSALGHRGLSAPVVTKDALVVADYQGYVHWLDKASGTLIARSRAGKDRVTNVPVVADDMVLVINDHGGISAFRSTPLAARGKPAGTAKDSAGE